MDSNTPVASTPKKNPLFETIQSSLDLFHTRSGQAYAITTQDGRAQILSVRSKKFFQLVMKKFYDLSGKVPSGFTITSMVSLLAINALEGREEEIFTRLGKVDGSIYFDLGNETGEQVKISAAKVELIASKQSAAKFLPTSCFLPQVVPDLNGNLAKLGQFINVENQEHVILIIAWVVMSLNTDGPYPILNIQGEQGSGKSFLCKLLRDLIDPAAPSLESFPRSEQDLLISASNGHLLAYDNLSSVSNPMSDILCRISTGGGQRTRQLYSDNDEVKFDVKKPLLVNGITDLFTRQDVCDRAIIVKTSVIPPEKRLPEDELRRRWEQEKPGILGGLYNAVSMALRNVDAVKLESYPRMADFAKFIVAAEPALPWQSGAFLKAYENNRMGIIEDAIEADPVASAVEKLLQVYPGGWMSTPSDLLNELNNFTLEEVRKLKIWPKLPNSLSGKISRCATFLRARNIDISSGKASGQRFISIVPANRPKPQPQALLPTPIPVLPM